DGGRRYALGASRRSAALVRDQRSDLVGHAIARRLASAGCCAAGARSILQEDALAASTSFAGLRHRPRNARRARKRVGGSVSLARRSLLLAVLGVVITSRCCSGQFAFSTLHASLPLT